ncbi:hypothetical protein BJ912DRAFT_686196 [Pholiota molesta]|nr:hypothetical protein BJ912DRAFT_686196 [Pholiota molesta]
MNTIMADTQSLPQRYYQYVATQNRVSDWVRQTRPTQQPGKHHRRTTQTIDSTQSTTTRSSSRRKSSLSSRRRMSADRIYSRTGLGGELSPLPPAIALVSSSLVVYALLPSIMAVSAFVILLTLASMDKQEKGSEPSKRTKLSERRNPIS